MQCYGIDPSPKMGVLARKILGQRGPIFNGHCEDLPFSDREFDLLLCSFRTHNHLRYMIQEAVWVLPREVSSVPRTGTLYPGAECTKKPQ